MASPQIENGYFKIANELAEAFARHSFTGNEWRILWATMRRTYGFNKSSDRIAYSQLVSDTGLPRRRVIEAVQSLVRKNVLGKKDNGPRTPATLWLNKDYESWVSAEKRTRADKPGAEKRTRKAKTSGTTGTSPQPSAEIRTNEGKIPLVRKSALVLVRKSALGGLVRKSALGEGFVSDVARAVAGDPSTLALVRKSAPTKDIRKDTEKDSTLPSSSSSDSLTGSVNQKNDRSDIALTHPDLFEASRRFHLFQQQQHPNKIKTLPEKKIRDGANVLRLLTERDGFDFYREILPALKWAVRDEFWAYQLLSLSSLRNKGRNGEMKMVNILASMEKARQRGGIQPQTWNQAQSAERKTMAQILNEQEEGLNGNRGGDQKGTNGSVSVLPGGGNGI